MAAALAGCDAPPHAALLKSPHASPRVPSSLARFADQRLVGANGATAWKLSATGLLVSHDAGRRWSVVSLPAGVAPSSIRTVTAAAGRGLWLAVWRSPAVGLYHEDAGAAGWNLHTLVPLLPSSDAFLAQQPPSVSITLGPAHLVTVFADWGFTNTAAYSSLFVSSDDGAAFAQHRTNIGLQLWTDTFESAWQGLVVAGPVMNVLYRTDDGGGSWSPVRIPGLDSAPSANYVSFGTPSADGTRLLLPVIVTRSGGALIISIYRSTNAGASFTGPTGPPLQVPAPLSAGQVTPAITGNVIWLPARGRIYESTNQGATWSTVTTALSPSTISLISPSQAIGIATDSGCRSFKADCYYYTYLVATDDGGRTWRIV